MPNWCATNYHIMGSKEDLQRFADIVNSLPNRKDAAPNDFGKFWLGNLVAALGGNYQKVPCRGIIDPNGYASACFCLDVVDEEAKIEIETSEKGNYITCTIQTAWCREKQLEAFIKEKFPSFEFIYHSTDEFNNFNVTNDTEDIMGIPTYEISGARLDECKDYSRNERDKFLADLREICEGLDIPEDITDEQLAQGEFVERFSEWRDSLGDGDESDIYYSVCLLEK